MAGFFRNDNFLPRNRGFPVGFLFQKDIQQSSIVLEKKHKFVFPIRMNLIVYQNKMKKITVNKAKAIVLFSMIRDLFVFSCLLGSIIYFLLRILGLDILYDKCFFTIVLIRSMYMGMFFYSSQDKINEVIEKTVEELNKKGE